MYKTLLLLKKIHWKFQWKDVAEFERRELLKMRVHHALRKASTAILARFSIRESLISRKSDL